MEYEPYIVGGLGTAATNLTKAYARSGVKVTVMSRSHNSRISRAGKQGLDTIRFPLSAAYYSSRTKQFKPAAIARWLSKHGHRKPAGIHIHSLQFMELAELYRTRYNIPVIYTCHSLVASEAKPRKKGRQKALRNQVRLLKLADKIVVPSRSELVKLKQLYPFCRKKAAVIHHGIVMRKALARGPRYRLLFVGRLVRVKGVDQLLKAVALLKRKDKKVRLDLVGTGSRKYKRYLHKLVDRLGISSEVHLIGFRKQGQMQRMYAGYGAVIMPSRQESFGLVALEALAGGIPLVSTQAGGLAEFVNNKVAQTIPKVEGSAIAAAIQSMWKHSQLTDRRVAAGRRVASRFQWPRAAGRYKKLFHNVKPKKKR